MNKKFISLVLAFVMVLGTFTSVFAAETVKKEETKEVPKITENDKKVQWLLDNKIVEGHKISKDGKETTDIALDENITRAQVSKLIIYSLGQQDLAEKVQSVKIYRDVEASHWANGFIIVGSTTASPVNPVYMLVGYPDGSFGPEKNVTYAELAKMLVVLVKKDLTQDMTNKAIWPASWLKWAAELGILEGLKIEDANKAANRKDAFVMLYNALYVMKYIEKEPANETLGIISKFEKDKLTLNQGDKAKTFTLDKETNFVTMENPTVNGPVQIKQAVSALNGYYYGSLVRLIADKDGKVTHILELGNPELKVASKGAWNHIAQEVVADKVNAELAVSGDQIKTIKVDGKVLDLVKGTRYFVADVTKNQLTEVDGVEKALAIVGYDKVNGQKIANVYAGYDVFKTSNEAKVVVFNNVAKDNNAGEMLRVKIETDSKYDATLENTKGEVIVKNLRSYNVYPYDYRDGKYDVVEHVSNFSGSYIKSEPVIDYSKASVFKVAKIDKDARELTLVDRVGKAEAVVNYTGDVKVFVEKDLVKGAMVQLRLNDRGFVDVISVVPDRELRGSFEKAGITDFKLTERYTADGNNVSVTGTTVYVANYENYKGDVVVRNDSFTVTDPDLLTDLQAAKAGVKVEFSVRKLNNDREMVNVKFIVDGKVMAVVDANALVELKAEIAKAKKALKDVVESEDGSKVEAGKKWAKKADMDTFKAAIKTAEKAAAEKTAKADFDGAKGTLTAAITQFTDTDVQTK